MPAFGRGSLRQRATIRDELKETLDAVVAIYDISILEGRRSWARQGELLRQDPPATTLQPGESKHNPPTEGDETWLSDAVDIAPHPIDWDDTNRFCYMAGLVIGVGSRLGHKIRWGGNWDQDQIILTDQSFDDLPHFEYLGPSNG